MCAAVEAEVVRDLTAAPGAGAAAKRLARSVGPPITPEIRESTSEALADTWETEEAREGVAAFFDKRPPDWGTG